MIRREAPSSREALLDRASALAGRTIGELAHELDARLPESTLRGKGFVGTLLEAALGATAGSRAEPDFPALGIELKTLPMSDRGRVLESTFVASIPLTSLAGLDFDMSPIGHKLREVLFIPVEGKPVTFVSRRIGAPLVWRADHTERELLERDYERLALRISRGELDSLSAHEGDAMQVRPKARRGADRRLFYDEAGAGHIEQPRGIYLRARFTESVIRRLRGSADSA